MLNKVKNHYNSIFITESFSNKNFQHMTIRKTAARGFSFTTFIVIIEFFMILISFFMPSFFHEGYVEIYRYHYIALFTVSLLSILILKYYYYHSESNDKPLYIVTIIVISFLIFWAGSITLVDLLHTPQISVYLTFILLMSIAPLLSPQIMAFIYLFTHTFFLIAIPYYQKSSDIVFSTRLNSSLFVFFAWIISRQLYKESYSNFTKDQLIASQNTDLQYSNNQLLKISRQDSMTKLHNRLSLDDILNKQWLVAKANDEALSILMIDIDAFKPFNDTYGHIKGDECLIQVSHILKKEAKRNTGIAFRYGGDVFCIIYRNITKSKLLEIIQEINKEIAALLVKISDTKSVSISLSIGHCHDKASQYNNPWLLINQADKSLYKIKSLK